MCMTNSIWLFKYYFYKWRIVSNRNNYSFVKIVFHVTNFHLPFELAYKFCLHCAHYTLKLWWQCLICISSSVSFVLVKCFTCIYNNISTFKIFEMDIIRYFSQIIPTSPAFYLIRDLLSYIYTINVFSRDF